MSIMKKISNLFQFVKNLFVHFKRINVQNSLLTMFLFGGGINQSQTFTFNIESKIQFMSDYRNIVSNISDASGIPNLRINKNISDKEFFTINLIYFDEKISLIYNSKDYYLLGFVEKTNTYYYFSDATLKNIPGVRASKNLGYTGSYIQLGMPGLFTQANIASYITTLQNFDGSKPVNLKKPLATIIFSTSEAFRFKSVAKNLYEIIETSNNMDSFTYEDDVKNWASLSTQALQETKDIIKKVNIAKKF